ncbi:hypothetical protein HJFPF1_05396 [Paramyrothecium foliicola]|nr:hypothetical protein HJFPF1_05396 [Paramyrothecium foliicola]
MHMGELADFLIQHDENFRKGRLPALYSDFRSQKTLNPDGYRANISAWRSALSRLASQGLLAKHSSNSSLFVLNVDDSLLRSLENKQYGQPLALGTVMREAVDQKELVPLQDFLKSQHNIYQRSWAGVPWSVVGWTLRQLGVVDPARGEDRLPKGKYAIMENLEAASRTFSQLMAEATSRFERTFTANQFEKDVATQLFQNQRLSDVDVDVFLKFLSRDKQMIEYDGQTIRYKATGEQDGITEEDASIASIKELTASLKHQTELLNNRIEELAESAKNAVARKSRVAALAALKSKKIAEASLATRYATLNQLEEVASRIEQASDQVQLVKVMESSAGVLKTLNAQVGGADRVDGVMDHLREQMANTDEVAAILAESAGAPVDEGEIDEELEAMEREETEAREKEQREQDEARNREEQAREAAEAQKKLDELPDVPAESQPEREKEQTPTTETGIASLSVNDSPQRQKEEPMTSM